MAAQIISELDSFAQILEARGNNALRLQAPKANNVASKVGRLNDLSDDAALTIAERADQVLGDHAHVVQSAVDAKLEGVQMSEDTSAKCQKFDSVGPVWLTQLDWDKLQPKFGLTVWCATITDRLQALGCFSPHEQTIKSIVALIVYLLQQTSTRTITPTDVYGLSQTVKEYFPKRRELARYVAAGVRAYTTPGALPDAVYNNAYPDESDPPIECDLRQYIAIRMKVRVRNTGTGLETVRRGGYATEHDGRCPPTPHSRAALSDNTLDDVVSLEGGAGLRIYGRRRAARERDIDDRDGDVDACLSRARVSHALANMPRKSRSALALCDDAAESPHHERESAPSPFTPLPRAASNHDAAYGGVAQDPPGRFTAADGTTHVVTHGGSSAHTGSEATPPWRKRPLPRDTATDKDESEYAEDLKYKELLMTKERKKEELAAKKAAEKAAKATEKAKGEATSGAVPAKRGRPSKAGAGVTMKKPAAASASSGPSFSIEWSRHQAMCRTGRKGDKCVALKFSDHGGVDKTVAAAKKWVRTHRSKAD